MGHEVESEDVHELLKKPRNLCKYGRVATRARIATKPLAGDLSSDEGEVKKIVPSSLIMEICAK